VFLLAQIHGQVGLEDAGDITYFDTQHHVSGFLSGRAAFLPNILMNGQNIFFNVSGDSGYFVLLEGSND
jgi:hypothetical protein